MPSWPQSCDVPYSADFRVFFGNHSALSSGKNLNGGINIWYHYLFIGSFTFLPKACAHEFYIPM